LRRPGAAAAQTDRIDHHVLAARAVDHFSLAHGTLTKTQGPGVLAVAQDENHAPRLTLVAERVHGIVERSP
jgi:hypothetical protein